MPIDVFFLAILILFIWIIISPVEYFCYLKEKKQLAQIFYGEYFRDENWYEEERNEIESIFASKSLDEAELVLFSNLKKSTLKWVKARKIEQKRMEKLIKRSDFPFFTIICFETELYFIKDNINSIEFYDRQIEGDTNVLRILENKHL